ncbi:TonB-dependent siderophore receptor [Alloalcanivorax marinus]|uniref:TonB-dependent siderophore receptor n=1 Tax=Alloalcanivorax marinus TaxID=1177169 RepID=UPI0019577AEB|nr:TonB-dependent siderophore receptor [Alloalcanivorax marinus]MBM7333034.1 TonB-dependent siderophore receptor [Alloalcanivorax marinus]
MQLLPIGGGRGFVVGAFLTLGGALWAPTALAQSPSGTVAPVEVEEEAPKETYITADEPADAGKLKVAAERQPFAITVIDQEFFQDTGVKNIQDALQYSSGVYSGSFGFDTRGDSAKIRGLNPTLYIDGLRASYGSYNSVRPNTFGLSKIEVLKGPSSVLYGQADLGGIINGVSKLPKPVKEGYLNAQVGSYDRKQVAADITGPLSEDGKLLYRLVALKRDSGTQVDYVDDNGYVFAPSITWLPTDDTTVSLLFNSQQNDGAVSAQFLPSRGTIDPGPLGDIGSETFVGEPGWDRYDRRKDEVTLFVDHRLNSEWSLGFTGRYTETETETREHWATISPTYPLADGTIARTIYMSDKGTEITNFDVRLEGDVLLGPTRHNVVFGVDRQDALWTEDNSFTGAGTDLNVYDPQYGNVNYAVLDPQDANDNEIKQTGVYVIDHMEIDRVVVSGALRYDDSTNKVLAVNGADTESTDTETTARLGLMYRFDSGISPYVSYSESFVPNLGTDGNGQSLDASTGEQREVGVKYLSPNKDLSVEAAWFDIEENNRVIDGNSPNSLEQVGATVDGWEISVIKQWQNLSLLANYTRLDAKEDSTGERLPYVAEEVASAWSKYQWENGLRVGAGVRYQGDTVGSDYGNGAGPEVPSVTLYDAMLGYSTGPWDFTLTGKNLADKEFVSWCRGPGYDCGYGERRMVIGEVGYRF